MSGFDAQMRTDAMILPLQQHSADSQIQSMRGIGEAVQQTVQMNQQQRQLAMQEQESSAKIQMWEVDRQVQQRKLMELQQIDMSESMRLDLEAKREQVNAMKFQNQQAVQHANELNPQQKVDMDVYQTYARLDQSQFEVDSSSGRPRIRARSKESRAQWDAQRDTERQKDTASAIEIAGARRSSADPSLVANRESDTKRDLLLTVENQIKMLDKRHEDLTEQISELERIARRPATTNEQRRSAQTELEIKTRQRSDIGKERDEAAKTLGTMIHGMTREATGQQAAAPDETPESYFSRHADVALKRLGIGK